MKIEKVCHICATAEVFWDVGAQQWEIINVYDDATCNDCGGETQLVDKEMGEHKEIIMANIAKTEFWSDHIDAPNTVMRKLSNETIERRMIEALNAHSGDGDVFACRTVHDSGSVHEKLFCFVKNNGVIERDEVDEADVGY